MISTKEFLIFTYCALVNFFALTSGLDIGEVCYMTNGSQGTCRHVNTCESAKNQLKQRLKPVVCGYEGVNPIVCCEEVNGNQGEGVDTLLRIAEEKCEDWIRGDLPKGVKVYHAFGGVNARPEEFPHMAILGYGNGEDIEWKCGGSLISEQYVLTAAHCLFSRQFGDVSSVRLGDLDIGNDTDKASPQDFKVAEAYQHPEYSSTSHYHDIAILKLDKPAIFNQYVRPACLQTTYDLKAVDFTATGWGATYFGGDLHTFLQKVQLNALPVESCMPTYKPHARLAKGLDDITQICAGNLQKAMDTCQGDSGGPLQSKVSYYPEIYKVVGITSFGKDCGLVPAIYTRVSNYIDWIESIVWP